MGEICIINNIFDEYLLRSIVGYKEDISPREISPIDKDGVNNGELQ